MKATIICEGANGPVTPAADAILEDTRRPRPAGRPGQRGRRDRLVLRVGAGPAGVLLARGRGQRKAPRHRREGVRGDVADRGRAGTRPCAWPPTGSRCSGSPRRRRPEASTRKTRRALPARGCHLCEARARRRARGSGRARRSSSSSSTSAAIRSSRRATASLAGRRDRRGARVHVLRRACRAPRAVATPTA